MKEPPSAGYSLNPVYIRDRERSTPRRSNAQSRKRRNVLAAPMSATDTELPDIVVLPVKRDERESRRSVDHPAWDVVDRTRLQAEASKNALGKARTVADSMALGLGTKLGALVYASNSAPIRPSNWPFFSGLNTSTASVSGVIGTPLPPKIIKLLPEQINEKTTVYAVFAIE